MIRFTEKDPSDIRDYSFDWTRVLATADPDDTIATSTWTIPAGLTKDSEANTTTTTRVWVRGGTAGENYTVTNRVTTAGGRTLERSALLPVRDR